MMKQLKPVSRQRERGAALIEVLVSVLIFCLAIMGLISMQSLVIKNNTENRYRADATTVAQRVLNDLQLDPSTMGTKEGTFDSATPGFGTPTWGSIVSSTLPGGKVEVDVDATDTSIVTITVTWTPRQESASLLTANYQHRYRMVASINPLDI